MADSVMTYKLVVKEIAMQHGLYASFMPKPVAEITGNGMHTHMSLFRGDKNVFYGDEDESHLSETAKQFCAGLMKHAREITSVTNQLPESSGQNVNDMSPEERYSRGIEPLPSNLYEAIQVTESSSLVKKALGNHVFDSFIANKKIEWDRYSSEISRYEIDRYLPLL